jgi:hypothetical protein
MEWSGEAVAEYLNRLPMVGWDRVVTVPMDGGYVYQIVYGWIPRADGLFDFVQMDFASWSDEPGFSTSSRRHSAEMNRLIYGATAAHHDCVKVADIPGLSELVERKVPW